MFSNFTIYLQRIGLAFGLSLALVGAVAAQTTADLEQPPNYDPASAGYGFRIGVNNFVTGVVDVFSDEAAVQRRIHLSDDYTRQCNKYKNNAGILARVVDRKEQLDEKLQAQAAALPTLKDEVARNFAEQRAVLLAAKSGAGSAAGAQLATVLNGATIREAQLTGKKGLPKEAEEQLAKFLSPDELTRIKSAADIDWAEGFKQFNALIAGKPGLGGVLEAEWHKGDILGHGGKLFLGAPPPEFLQRFEIIGDAAKLGFLQDPEAVNRYKDQIGKFDLKFDFNEKDFGKFLPPEQVERFKNFHSEINSRFGGDPTKIDQSFFKDFDAKHGPPLEGQPTSSAPNYVPPSNGQFSPTSSPTPSPTSSPTYTTPTQTQGSCPSGYTGTYPNCSPTSSPTPSPTSSPTPTSSSCPSGYHYDSLQGKCVL